MTPNKELFLNRLTNWRNSIEMGKDKKKHDWNKEQPHHVVTGKITTENYARNHPEKVEWVKEKKGKKNK